MTISNYIKYKILGYLLAVVAVLFSCGGAFALPVQHYASSSRLASGRWVKVKSPSDGMVLVTEAMMRANGLDPAKTNVYGFGGRLTPDVLSSDVADDLPKLPCVRTDKGIVFYATDAVSWDYSGSEVKHWMNPYCEQSYYFLSDSDAEPAVMEKAEAVSYAEDCSPAINSFTDYLLHERDLFSPSNTGRLMLGEDFRSQPSRTFSFSMPQKQSDWVGYSVNFGTRSSGSSSRLAVSANGVKLNGSGSVIDAISTSETFMQPLTVKGSTSVSGESLEIKLDYTSPSSGSLGLAALDFIEICYDRRLELPKSGVLVFDINPNVVSKVEIAGVDDSVRVWDVTLSHEPKEVSGEISGGVFRFGAPAGHRTYVAFKPSQVSAAVVACGVVKNQDIHSLPAPDLVMIAPRECRDAAERVAQMRRETDGLSVYVLDPEQIYNEFSSGSPDVGAFRKMLKMWVDRDGEGPSGMIHCLLWGRPDHNYKTSTNQYVTLPIWLSPEGLSQASSFSTDFYIGMTDDCDGDFKIGEQKVRVAIGRLPVKSSVEANAMADKLIRYCTRPDFGAWRNNFMVIADDQDNGIHLDQAETYLSYLKKNPLSQSYIYEKLYLDAYPLEFSSVGPAYPAAKSRMMELIERGCMYITYIGHASPRGWGHEKLLTWDDITSFANNRWPFIYAATCEFGRWDDDTVSGAEELLLNPKAGIIGMITPSRTVYITNNGLLTSSLGKQTFRSGTSGRIATVGESFVNALNGMTSRDDNKLRYCVISDPSLRLPMPSKSIEVTHIDGIDVRNLTSGFPELQAQGKSVIKGRVINADGSTDSGFNGTLEASLYDAEMPVTTNGNGEKGEARTYNDRRVCLLRARASVKDGEFEFTALMPPYVENNYSPALLNLYAWTDGGEEANGASTNLYAYGYADPDDTVKGIEITKFTLNNESFRDGDLTHANPLVLATINAPAGLNLSDSGLGNKMTLTLDSKTVYDRLDSGLVLDIDNPGTANLQYVISDLEPGDHVLKLTCKDNAGNLASAHLNFQVGLNIKPQVYSVDTDVNPASTSVTFLISHDHAAVNSRNIVDVFDLSGRKVWSGIAEGKSYDGQNVEINWNLEDGNGRRVPRGIYVYRATVTTAEGVSATSSKKLAVTAQ